MEVTEDWIKDHTDIEEVAHYCQPALRVSNALGESWDPGHVHFIIMVKDAVRGEDLVLIPWSHIALNLPRFQGC